MPKLIQYKQNSVVYFAGDLDDRVFLLNNGNIALTSTDIQSGKQVTEFIKKGEFFGVKSALGHFPREEDAMILKDSTVCAFSREEFELFCQKNTHIILKMIKVFSRKLRTLHRRLEAMLDSHQETNPEEGLFSVVSAFYGSKNATAAYQIAQRYTALYPNGRHQLEVQNIMRLTQDVASKTEQELASIGLDTGATGSLAVADDLFAKQDWNNAYRQYQILMETDNVDAEKAFVGAGKCLFESKDFVRCLKLLSTFITKYPKSLKLGEVLMYMGKTYQSMGHADKALSFYNKALDLAGPLLVPEIQKLKASCGGN